MNRKIVYTFSLAGFSLMWGVFGLAAASLPGETNLQATVPAVENAPSLPGEAGSAGIPVTGEPEPVWTEILIFYGLIGFAALCLILALLSFANRSTAPFVGRKRGPSEETYEN